jgi:hypothetical protein
MHICSYMCSLLPQMLYTVWCLSKLYAHKNNCKKQLVGGKRREKKTARIGANVRACVFNARLLTISQFASGRSCDWPIWSRFSVVFFGPRANAELVLKFHFAFHALHATLPMVTLNISPYTNVTLAFDFDFALYHPVHGGYGWGRPTWRRKKVTVKQRKLKSGHEPHHQDELADW